MSDNVPITAGSGTSIATDDIGSVQYQRVKLIHGADGANDGDVANGNGLPVRAMSTPLNIDVSITRPADTTAYAANDAWANSTSAPTSGGFTFTNAARVPGGSGLILGAMISSTKDASALQGEIHVFDTAPTEINDNAAFSPSEGDGQKLVGIIPFTLSGETNFGRASITGLNIPYTCSGSANLRFLVKVTAAYTPISAEVLKIRLFVLCLN